MIHFWINYHYTYALGTPVNYLFTMGPTNPVTDFFYNLLPYKYFYMYTTFPIILLLYVCVYFKSKLSRKGDDIYE